MQNNREILILEILPYTVQRIFMHSNLLNTMEPLFYIFLRWMKMYQEAGNCKIQVHRKEDF